MESKNLPVPISAPNLTSSDFALMERMAEHMYRSRFFKDCQAVSQALTKIILGRALGLDAATSMMGLFINSQGKLSMSANLMARCIKACGKYRYRIQKHTREECSIQVWERTEEGQWEECGPPETVHIKDFEHLQKNPTWKQYPKNMLFARAISNIAKFHCPDAFGGSPVYLPDEIPNSGLEVDGNTLEVVSCESVVPEWEVKEAEVETEDSRELSCFMKEQGVDGAWVAKVLNIPEEEVTEPDNAKHVLQLLKVKFGVSKEKA